MTKTGNDDTEGPAEKAARTGNGLGLSPIQIIAGGGAAAVASVIGGNLGLGGTVVGAFILSVVSAIALPLFRASLEKSHEQIKRVMPRRITDAPRTTRPEIALPSPLKSPKGRMAWAAVGGTAIIFLIGVGSILGIQSATGLALSKGTSALQSGITHVVSNANDGKGTPATNPKPRAPAAEPSTVSTDPATEPAEQPTATPTLTSDPAPSAEPTAPAVAQTQVPSSTPDPAAGTSNAGSGANGADSQTQPSAGLSDKRCVGPAGFH